MKGNKETGKIVQQNRQITLKYNLKVFETP
ncbi:hypothetical protein CHFL109739_01590 [Chryseobacterium flavum]